MNERNYGIDIFRILCCIGVLIYHTVDDVLGRGVHMFCIMERVSVFQDFFCCRGI